VSPAPQVDPTSRRDAGAGPRRATFDQVVAHGLETFEVRSAAVDHAVVDVAQLVVADRNLARVLGIDAPQPVLDHQTLHHHVGDRRRAAGADRDHPAVGVVAVDHRSSVTRPNEGDRRAGGSTGGDLEGGVTPRCHQEHVTRSRRVRRRLQPEERIRRGTAATTRPRRDVAQRPHRRVRHLGASRSGNHTHLPAAVGIGEGEAQLVAGARLEEHHTRGPVVQPERGTVDDHLGPRAHRGRAGPPGDLTDPPKLEGHRAVEVVVATDLPPYPDTLEGRIHPARTRHDRIERKQRRCAQSSREP
jgi:hypothetical protein